MRLDQRLKKLEQALRPPGMQRIVPRIVEDGEDCDKRKPECPAGQYPKCTRNKNCWSRLAGDEIIYIGLKDYDE